MQSYIYRTIFVTSMYTYDNIVTLSRFNGIQDLPMIYMAMRYGFQLFNNVLKYMKIDKILETVTASCINEDNYAEVKSPLAPNVEWKHKWSAIPTKEEFMSRKCENIGQAKLFRIAPTLVNGPKPIAYHVCPATNYCAAKRQATVVPQADEQMITRFSKWFDTKMIPEIEWLLYGMVPDYNKWFNHLSASKQKPIQLIND